MVEKPLTTRIDPTAMIVLNIRLFISILVCGEAGVDVFKGVSSQTAIETACSDAGDWSWRESVLWLSHGGGASIALCVVTTKVSSNNVRVNCFM